MIELVGLVKEYGAARVVDEVTLSVPGGELLVLVGDSGSGKTTTLKMINRLVEPTRGQVRIDGRDTREVPGHLLRRGIGYVLQQVGLFPHLTVGENVGLPLQLAGWERDRVAARVDQVLALAELDPGLAARRPDELSGGQRQRAGVARALAAAPRVMLLDEPFGALDPLTRDRLQATFATIRRALGLTAVLVTHDMAEALLLADRIAVLRGGRLVQHGTPAELVRHPADPLVEQMLDTPRRHAKAYDALAAAVDELLADLPAFLGGHLRISVAALTVGVGLSVPLGVAASRARWLERPVLAAARVVQTIPSLAMLAAMVPLLAAIGLPSIGVLPAFLGLVAYSALPVLQNTVVGLRGIDPSLIETADALGMTSGERLRRIELPLAMPVILGGVRTATVWTVGAATLSTPVGATSLGNYIFTGLQTGNHASVLLGCVVAASLALGLDAAVARLSTLAERRPRAAGTIVATALAVAALTGLAPMALGDRTDPVVIGAKTFTEQYVLAEILGDTLERAGVPSEVRSSLGSTVAFDALRAGDIDTYVDYSGTLWATILHDSPPPDRAEALDALRIALGERYGVGVVAALGFENAYVLAMRRDRALALGARSIGDLALVAPGLAVGGDYEFFARPEWASVRRVYGLTFREERRMDPSLLYEAAGNGDVDVIGAYSTDGRIAAYDLATLADDRGAIPAYDAVVLTRPGLDRDNPAAVRALASLAGTIDADLMRALNGRVDEAGESPSEAASHARDPR